MAYLGNAPGVESQRLTTTFTATASQTNFTPTGGYTLGYVDVYLNGVKLIDGTDYTAADGVTVVLTVGAALNDDVEIVTYTPRGLSDGYTKTEADARYVNVTGDTMTGGLTVDTDIAVGATGANSSKLRLHAQGLAGAPHLMFTDTTSNKQNEIRQDSSGNFILDHWNGTSRDEQLRVTDGGFLLVGTSTTYPGVPGLGGNIGGFMVEDAGSVFSSRVDGGIPFYGNRNVNGDFFRMYLAGTTDTASVGTYANEVYLHCNTGGSTGIRLGYQAVVPSTTSANNDAAINLGAANNRFKDLHMSGEIRNPTPAGTATQTLIGAVTGISNGFDVSTAVDNTSSMAFTNSTGTVIKCESNGVTTAYQRFQATDSGVGADTATYATLGATRSSSVSASGFGKSYLALTRAGQFVWGMGVDDSNSFRIGTPNTSAELQDASGLTITGTKNVGIGVTNPSQKLSVFGGGNRYAETDGGNYRLRLAASEGGWELPYQMMANDGTELAAMVGAGNSQTLGALYWRTDGTEHMRLTSSGYLKATNTGTYPGGVSTTYHELVSDANGSVLGVFRHTHTTNPYGILLDFTSSAPNNGTNYFLNCADQTNTRAVIYSNGGIANYQANDTNLSDEREKKDIETLDSTWHCVESWDLVKYRYNDDEAESPKKYGVIAQQVEQHCPEVIADWNKGTEDEPVMRKGVKEQQMYWMAIKALQEAMTRIETLEAKVATLEAGA